MRQTLAVRFFGQHLIYAEKTDRIRFQSDTGGQKKYHSSDTRVHTRDFLIIYYGNL